MKSFIPKFALALPFVFFASSAAIADGQPSCHFAFGSGVTEQVVAAPGQIPNSNSNIGFLKLRIGRTLLHGTVDVLVTEGYNVPSYNAATNETRITGFGKGTFDFGELGAFHTWEVGTATLIGPYPWEWQTSTLLGDIRTGPRRDFVPTPGAPPMPWGAGFFAHADVTFKGLGWNRFAVVKDDGSVVNEFTYILWGKICGVDLKGIRSARRS